MKKKKLQREDRISLSSLKEKNLILREAADMLGAEPEHLPAQIMKFKKEIKEMEEEIKEIR